MGKQLNLDQMIADAGIPPKPVPQFNAAAMRAQLAGSRRPVDDLASGKMKAELAKRYPDRPNVAIARKMPVQKPGKSKQDYSTPDDLMQAIKAKFGIKAFTYDLAASKENAKGSIYFTEAQDSLKQNWAKLRGNLWLNPPFSRIAPWAQKCWLASEQRLEADRIFFLVPAAPGSNWWRDFVHEKARVIFLNGRPCFDGKGGFPKDVVIAVYGEKPSYEIWSWRAKKGT